MKPPKKLSPELSKQDDTQQLSKQNSPDPSTISGDSEASSSSASVILEKQETETLAPGKILTSEQECQSGSDEDSSPNPPSPKRARMSRKVKSDTKENISSQPGVTDIATQQEDSPTTSQIMEFSKTQTSEFPKETTSSSPPSTLSADSEASTSSARVYLENPDLMELATGAIVTSEQESQSRSDGDSGPNPLSRKRARMSGKDKLITKIMKFSKTKTSALPKETTSSSPPSTLSADSEASSSSERFHPEKQEVKELTSGTILASEQGCQSGSDGDSSSTPPSPKRARQSGKVKSVTEIKEFPKQQTSEFPKEHTSSSPPSTLSADSEASSSSARVYLERQEIEELTSGTIVTPEQECQSGSDGDSSPNPPSPKRARISEKVKSDSKENISSQPGFSSIVTQHEDSQTTTQEQESNDTTKPSDDGTSPGCSNSGTSEHDDLNPHDTPKQVAGDPLVLEQLEQLEELPFNEFQFLHLHEEVILVYGDDFEEHFPLEPIGPQERDAFLWTQHVYECIYCDMLFRYCQVYRIHMIAHRRYSPICGCSFVCVCGGAHHHNNKFYFNLHLLRDAHDITQYEEEELIEWYGLPGYINNERKDHWATFPVYHCRCCSIMYKDFELYALHIQAHINFEIDVFICGWCGEDTDDRNFLNLHLFEYEHFV